MVQNYNNFDSQSIRGYVVSKYSQNVIAGKITDIYLSILDLNGKI